MRIRGSRPSSLLGEISIMVVHILPKDMARVRFPYFAPVAMGEARSNFFGYMHQVYILKSLKDYKTYTGYAR
jgi:hypothetical protein